VTQCIYPKGVHGSAMRGLFGICLLVLASAVMFSPFVKNEYADFFGYLTNSLVYFVHLPFFTVVLLAYNRTPKQILRYFPNCAAMAIGVWLGVQCILLCQQSNGTLHLLTMGGAVGVGVGVVGNEIIHTLPVIMYTWIAFVEHDSLCNSEHKIVAFDVLLPLVIGSIFFTLNEEIDEYYKLSSTGVIVSASVVVASSCITTIMIKKNITI
jgi:hypothetical protein